MGRTQRSAAAGRGSSLLNPTYFLLHFCSFFLVTLCYLSKEYGIKSNLSILKCGFSDKKLLIVKILFLCYHLFMADYIRARSDEHKEERLSQIKEATAELFSAFPYSEITLTTIAEKLGRNR